MVLFEALERTDAAHFKRINALWQGKAVHFVEPQELTDPAQRHERSEQFLDIQVCGENEALWYTAALHR